MREEQGYVHIPMTAGSADGLTITSSEDATCSRCGVRGGDMVVFTCDVGTQARTLRSMRVHVACMEALTYMYRTGRKPRAQRKGA